MKLLIRAERSERRSAAVEEEMMEMARTHAREVAALKLQLAEKEAQLMGGAQGIVAATWEGSIREWERGEGRDEGAI